VWLSLRLPHPTILLGNVKGRDRCLAIPGRFTRAVSTREASHLGVYVGQTSALHSNAIQLEHRSHCQI